MPAVGRVCDVGCDIPVMPAGAVGDRPGSVGGKFGGGSGSVRLDAPLIGVGPPAFIVETGLVAVLTGAGPIEDIGPLRPDGVVLWQPARPRLASSSIRTSFPA